MGKERKITSIYIDEELCKGCRICIELCAKDVFTISEQINQRGYLVPVPTHLAQCTSCLLCELICPELAVILVQSTDK